VILKFRLVLIPHFGELRLEKSFFGFEIVLELKFGKDVEGVRLRVVNGVVSCVVLAVEDGLNVRFLFVVFGTDVDTLTVGLTV